MSEALGNSNTDQPEVFPDIITNKDGIIADLRAEFRETAENTAATPEQQMDEQEYRTRIQLAPEDVLEKLLQGFTDAARKPMSREEVLTLLPRNKLMEITMRLMYDIASQALSIFNSFECQKLLLLDKQGMDKKRSPWVAQSPEQKRIERCIAQQRQKFLASKSETANLIVEGFLRICKKMPKESTLAARINYLFGDDFAQSFPPSFPDFSSGFSHSKFWTHILENNLPSIAFNRLRAEAAALLCAAHVQSALSSLEKEENTMLENAAFLSGEDASPENIVAAYFLDVCDRCAGDRAPAIAQ